MLKNKESNGTEEIGLVTPTHGLQLATSLFYPHFVNSSSSRVVLSQGPVWYIASVTVAQSVT